MVVGIYDGAVSPILQLLVLASRTRGGQPLLTHYRPQDGERTELSVASFANWVDKTANLLDDLGVDEDSLVVLPVLADRPGHWMGLVWPFALWQRGLAANVRPREHSSDADLAVIGPDDPTAVALDTIACSLHPWGLALQGLPAGVLDFSSEALAQPDLHHSVAADPDAPAWNDAERDLIFAELFELSGVSSRVALVPRDAWDAVASIARAILGGGSVVLVEGTRAEADEIAATERAVFMGW